MLGEEKTASGILCYGWLLMRFCNLGPAYPHGEPVHGGPHEDVHTLPPV